MNFKISAFLSILSKESLSLQKLYHECNKISIWLIFYQKKTLVSKDNSRAYSIWLCKNAQDAGLDTVQSSKKGLFPNIQI